MDIQNLFKKKFVMLDANDTSIKEKDNMFDNVIDNKFINALFEKYNIPAKYRYFIFENKERNRCFKIYTTKTTDSDKTTEQRKRERK